MEAISGRSRIPLNSLPFKGGGIIGQIISRCNCETDPKIVLDRDALSGICGRDLKELRPSGRKFITTADCGLAYVI